MKTQVISGNSDMTKHRLDVDFARGLAITMIVMAHLIRRGVVADYLSSTGVALFFFLSGFVYHWKENRKEYWLGRLRRLYLPYLAVGLISILLFYYLGDIAASELHVRMPVDKMKFTAFLFSLLYANSKDHSMKWNESLWFIPCFLIVLGLVNILEHFLVFADHKRMQHKERQGQGHRQAIAIHKISHKGTGLSLTYTVWIRILAMTAALLTHFVLTQRYRARLPWQMETALGMFWLYEAGIMAHEYAQFRHIQQSSRRPLLLTAFALLCLQLALTIVNGQISIRTDEYPHYILSGIVLLTGAAGYTSLCHLLCTSSPYISGQQDQICRKTRFPTLLLRLCAYAGCHSLDILLWNKFPVLFFQVIVSRLTPGFAGLFVQNNTPTGFFVSLLLAASSIALCLAWARLLHLFSEIRLQRR